MEKDNKTETNENNQMKKIIYKGKEKIIPIKNPDLTKCEQYIVKKGRYCHFDKYKGSEYCVYHRTEKDEYLIFPYDPKHRILKDKYKSHLKVCNTLMNEKNLEKNEWFIKNYNKSKPDKNFPLPPDEDLMKIYNQKYEHLSIEEFEHYIQIILDSYEIAKKLYSSYIKENDLENYVNKNLNTNIKNKEIFYSISGLNIDSEKDLKHTEQRQHFRKTYYTK